MWRISRCHDAHKKSRQRRLKISTAPLLPGGALKVVGRATPGSDIPTRSVSPVTS